ncbi:putative methyltransferase At1g27930 [Labeo rohita]|uniref:Methyltransferase At1g27930 n=1 Tax=Labeo rohita TaxID=84645 RepID=A0ABQ8MSF9_LABRO|nr:putative methyltransferase At1g27930 [Labeo rohita]
MALTSKIKESADSLGKMITKNTISEVEQKLNEVERYQRRWSLCLYAIPEQSDENIKLKVSNICAAVVPDSSVAIQDDIDIVHRLGKLDNRPRPVIIHFVKRSTRDLVWRQTKHSEYLRYHKLRFTEDLTQADRMLRMKLWPLVEAARKEGKRAFFVGGRAFVDEKAMHPPP